MAVNAFQSMYNGIANTISGIYNTVVNGFQNAINFITSLPSRAWGWGSEIINGVINGIQNAIGSLMSVMSNVADTIASYIHFSEPDKGALSNFHTFMPDMMSQLAQGIENGLPKIEDAMDSMTRTMVPSMGGGNSGAVTNNNSNSVSINVYGTQGMDVNELASVIEQKITNNVVRKGVAFG